MEAFTLSEETCNLQLESPDVIRHAFTMETFALLSHNPMANSCVMEAPCPQGGQHLPMETFTLVSQILEFSSPSDAPVGKFAPCVYKAAHRRSRFDATVSPSELRAILLAIANPAGTLPNCFDSFLRFPYA